MRWCLMLGPAAEIAVSAAVDPVELDHALVFDLGQPLLDAGWRQVVVREQGAADGDGCGDEAPFIVGHLRDEAGEGKACVAGEATHFVVLPEGGLERA